MSQQINLILPDLQPKLDWLDLRWVSLAAAVLTLLILALSWGVQRDMTAAEATRASVQSELDSLQKMVGEMNKSILERKPDPLLVAEVNYQREAASLKYQALQLLDEGRAGSTRGYAELMTGFSRQVMEGVWLTGFDFVGKEIEIRGRLRDYSLLPAYIRRLNAEDTFRRYRFSALDMKGVEPKDIKAPGASTAQAYTEFVLRSSDNDKDGAAETAGPESKEEKPTLTGMAISGAQAGLSAQAITDTLVRAAEKANQR
jgi:Tfp pilus assembly protein PilN